MRLIKNTGIDRVIDELRHTLGPQSTLDLASPAFSLFAFAELREVLDKLDTCRMVLPEPKDADLGLTGSENDRAFRNRLHVRRLAGECAAWIKKKVELRIAPVPLPQSILIAGKPESEHHRVITGNCAFTTEGLGLTPGNQFSLIQCSERPEESAVLGGWFAALWSTLPGADQHKAAFLARLQALVDPKPPSLIYYLTLFHVFKDLGDQLDEEPWGRRIGQGLDPHHVEIACSRLQLGTATGAEQRGLARLAGSIHGGIVRHPAVAVEEANLVQQRRIAFTVLLHEPVYASDEAAGVRLAVQRVEWAALSIPGEDSTHGEEETASRRESRQGTKPTGTPLMDRGD